MKKGYTNKELKKMSTKRLERVWLLTDSEYLGERIYWLCSGRDRKKRC